MNGFVSALAKFDDKNKGLDLIIETPGGATAATEFIVEYLKKQFRDNIRVIVPHLCMSAGTMIACASKEILMLPSSSLGPFDPQYFGVPCQGVIKVFEDAINDIEKNPNRSLI
jgi:ClpP class serine protease